MTHDQIESAKKPTVREFQEWLNERRNLNVSAIFHETVAQYRIALSTSAAADSTHRSATMSNDLIEALEELMAWQVKHVKVWNNPAYDNAHRVLEEHRSQQEAAQEPVYQITCAFLDDPANTWRDATRAAFDLQPAEHRRVLYTASPAPSESAAKDAALAMMGPELAATVATQGPPTPKRTQRREPQRYRGMTEEQRAWNQAVDLRKSSKGRTSP